MTELTLTEIAETAWAGFLGSSWLDPINAILGIAGVVLMIRRSLWAFPIGMLAVSTQGILFVRSHFPADALLQVFFFVALGWGWRHWRTAERTERPIRRLRLREGIVTLALAIVAMVLWVQTAGLWLVAVMPWRDAFIAVFSVAAQVLQVRKCIENWPLWLVVNTIAVVSYWQAGITYTALLTLVYGVLALMGWREWHRALRTTQAELPSKPL